MSNNKNLHNAKLAKYDEFYTLYADIEKELSNYDFNGKVVYCNCDDYRSSKFFEYFYNNFKALGLKKLLCTGYIENGNGKYASYNGKTLYTDDLLGEGSYDSEECWMCLQVCDVVVTNPPFSLFRDYVKYLLNNKKQFIIIGIEASVTYKDVFPYVMNNQLWIGHNLVKEFSTPNGEIVKFGNICWYTNVISKNDVKNLPVSNTKSKSYKKYDNYDAIEIGSIKNIPNDYFGVMGVPVSFVKYYNPMVFDIVGVTSSSVENAGKYFLGKNGTRPLLDGKRKFTRILIKRKNKMQLVS